MKVVVLLCCFCVVLFVWAVRAFFGRLWFLCDAGAVCSLVLVCCYLFVLVLWFEFVCVWCGVVYFILFLFDVF